MDETERPEAAALEPEPAAGPRRSPVWAVVAGVVAVVVLAVVIGVAVNGGSKSHTPLGAAADTGLNLAPGGRMGNGAAAMPFAPRRYLLDVPLPDLGDHAAAYRLDAPPIDISTMQQYADVLGIHGTVQGAGHGMSVSDGDAHLLVLNGPQAFFSYSTGVVSSSGGVVSGVVGSTNETSSTTVPAATNNAQNVATHTLQKLGVLGNTADWNVTATGGHVTLTRLVDGVPVSGDQWIVDVADDDTISTIQGTRGTPTKIADVPIRSTTDVWQDVVNGTYISPGPRPLALGAVGAPITVVPLPAQAAPTSESTSTPTSGPTPTSGAAPTSESTPTSSETSTSTATTVVPPPYDVHITGVTLGLALWPTTLATTDLVPTYRFAEKDGGQLEALAVTDAAFGTPPTAAPPTTFSVITAPTVTGFPNKFNGGVKVIATMHVVPGTPETRARYVRIALSTPSGGAQSSFTINLSQSDGATATAHVPLGHYFVNSYGTATPAEPMMHAESQFTAQNGETVHLDLHYGGTVPTITTTVTPP